MCTSPVESLISPKFAGHETDFRHQQSLSATDGEGFRFLCVSRRLANSAAFNYSGLRSAMVAPACPV